MDKKYLHDKQSAQLSLLVSLLFHLVFIFYLLMNNHHTILESKQTKIIQDTSRNDTIEWIETKTKLSTHIPVYFHDDYTEDTLTAKNGTTIDTYQDIQDNHSDITQNPPQQQLQHNTTVQTQQIKQKKHAAHQAARPAPSSQRQLPSLSQLTQGMMNYMKENGKHSVSMLGKKTGIPTDEQLKYECYLEKLNRCLHNSFAINSHKQPHCAPPDSPITMYLALNQDGSIHNLKLVKSCGNHQIDHFVMYVLREASSSFPPVPHYLPHNPFAIHYIIESKHL